MLSTKKKHKQISKLAVRIAYTFIMVFQHKFMPTLLLNIGTNNMAKVPFRYQFFLIVPEFSMSQTTSSINIFNVWIPKEIGSAQQIKTKKYQHVG